jgi:hypothetical protein
MTSIALQQILARAAAEPQFREHLLSDPAQALAGYDLNAEERTALFHLSPENFEAEVGLIEERLSKGFAWGT